MYEARIHNKYNYGHTVFRRETLGEIKEELKKYLFDIGSIISVYEIKEVQIDANCYETWDPGKYTFKNSWDSKTLYEDGCIYKNRVNVIE